MKMKISARVAGFGQLQLSCGGLILLGGMLTVSLGFSHLHAQTGSLRGVVRDAATQTPLAGAIVALTPAERVVETDATGTYQITKLPYGTYQVTVYAFGKNVVQQNLFINQPQQQLDWSLTVLAADIATITVQGAREKNLGLSRLRSVEGVAIYEGKKSEVVSLDAISANLATNNARQVFARIAGLNIWESDGAGLQLGIGGRGLSPNRTSNFNTRQNGYDISADALGYPESYYTPPTEALERIEVVRGAASLQYGTQFGGMVNFVFQKAPLDQPFTLLSRQTVGSYGFRGSFNRVAGTLAQQKFRYSAFFQTKAGDGWRENSGFQLHNGYLALETRPTERLTLGVEATLMDYLAQQPGGLTDAFFDQNARQSLRERNWFQVKWNLFSAYLDYQFNEKTRLNWRSFGLAARRQALGNLSPINNIDFGGNRDLIDGRFNNLGSELRVLHRYRLGAKDQTFLVGARWYRGTTTARQGEADAGAAANFSFLRPNDVERSDYTFPNYNLAFFAENIIYLHPRFTVTPGVRWENIQTLAEGYYKQRVFDAAGNLIVENRLEESLDRRRSLLLLGLGLSYQWSEDWETYANFSQNYRAINFSDLRIENPNGRVDPNLQDERGYTADLGLRSKSNERFYFDFTAFYLAYRDRIGLLLRADQPPLFNDYRLRTNIADARNLGLEAFAEWNFWPNLFPSDTLTRLSCFVNLALIDARYINTDDSSIRNKRVELVAPITLRSGLNWRRGPWQAGATIAFTAQHYTDATNAVRTASAVNGIIPAYTVADLTAAYRWRWLTLEGSCNNLLDERYFTRRAEGYPGPGIIPADGRSFFLTAQVYLGR